MVIVANKTENTDGPAHQMLSKINSAIPIVLISRSHDFTFNEKLSSLGKYVLADFSEYGWDVDLTKYGTHIWGQNTMLYDSQFPGDEYRRFDEWVAKNPPLLTFKRELLKVDQKENILPIEYPCWNDIPEIQSKEQFNQRPIGCFYFWGRSHEDRLRVHGEIWANASKYGYSVCDNVFFINHFLANEGGAKWVSLWMPHYSRIDIKEILAVNGYSKTSLALPGAGVKTFRNCESSINSAMVMWADHLAWTFPWDKTNSIQCRKGNEVKTIHNAIQDENLYDIYVNGVENCRKYQIQNYISHLENIINELVAI